MVFLELVEIAEGKYKEKDKTSAQPACVTKSDLMLFRRLLRTQDIYTESFNKTDSAKEFYEAFELFRKIIPDNVKEDAFYSAKVGYYFEGVPSKLVYILKQAISKGATPSLALQSVSPLVWGRFLKEGSLPEGITIKDVLESIYGYEVQLLSKSQKKIQYSDYSEIYVENVDKIVLLPNDIADQFASIDDLSSIKYVPKKGVCFEEMPLRFFNGRKGITLDEFDLRDAK
ncbi:MAG: hypothetical protein IJE43_19315 [Alphaproteobacteria bacterium]|nr:hypothetical protein [Alphaproteobacteria bacterium]